MSVAKWSFCFNKLIDIHTRIDKVEYMERLKANREVNIPAINSPINIVIAEHVKLG